jgi:uncharacterized protein YjlB
MSHLKPNKPTQIIHKLFPPNNFFPNNSRYPLLIYKKVLTFTDETTDMVQNFLQTNQWRNSWVNSIYDYDHYHSNTHEVLVIFKGSCDVLIGGPGGETFTIAQGDVIIFPAGVSHKNISSSSDFKTIGAYPFDVQYDMNYGKESEHPKVDQNIKAVGLPECDPIFGEDGILFQYWEE